MDENIELTILYDIYGKLLTKKQQSIFEEYFIYNLSLREIAENKKISYQAVRDSIESSKETLRNFEANIHMLEVKQNIFKINELVTQNKNNLESVKEKLLEEIENINK